MTAKPSVPALLLAGMALAAPSASRAAEPPKPEWLRVERHRVLDGRTRTTWRPAASAWTG